MLIEFPTEEGQTRLLVFTSDFSNFGKIGTLSKTRSYITSIADNFGAILLSLGDDTRIISASNTLQGEKHISLDTSDGYHYTEYTHYAYTNSSLINSAITNLGIDMYSSTPPILPFYYTDNRDSVTKKDIQAQRIYLPYSISQDTSFTYSSITEKYTYEKSGIPKKDNLTNEFITFDNIFILFADSVTYEDRGGVTMNMETTKGGEGYYISAGRAAKILWSGEGDTLKFTTDAGIPLVVSPGINYIGYVKSSRYDEVQIS
jgi:hypothetical protein